MKQHDKVIILDFDHTIINTTPLIAGIAARLEKDFGITEQQYMDARKAIQQCCIVEDIDKVIDHLGPADPAAVHDAFHDVIRRDVHKYVFDDVVDFINRHKDTFDIVISTHGDKELQGEKIKHAGLPDCIQMAIEPKDKGDVLAEYVAQYDEVHFIDDKAENIDTVKKKNPSVITYFIKRPEDCKYCSIPPKENCASKIIEDLKFTI